MHRLRQIDSKAFVILWVRMKQKSQRKSWRIFSRKITHVNFITKRHLPATCETKGPFCENCLLTCMKFWLIFAKLFVFAKIFANQVFVFSKIFAKIFFLSPGGVIKTFSVTRNTPPDSYKVLLLPGIFLSPILQLDAA